MFYNSDQHVYEHQLLPEDENKFNFTYKPTNRDKVSDSNIKAMTSAMECLLSHPVTQAYVDCIKATPAQEQDLLKLARQHIIIICILRAEF